MEVELWYDEVLVEQKKTFKTGCWCTVYVFYHERLLCIRFIKYYQDYNQMRS